VACEKAARTIRTKAAHLQFQKRIPVLEAKDVVIIARPLAQFEGFVMIILTQCSDGHPITPANLW